MWNSGESNADKEGNMKQKLGVIDASVVMDTRFRV